MTEYISEFGKRWDARVPRGDLKFVVNRRYHASTLDDVVERDVRRLCTKDPRFTPRLVEQSVRYALLVHKRNRALFNHVMRGVV